MKKALFARLAGALLVFLLAAFAVPSEVEIGKAVPDFTLKGIDGKTYQLSQFKGKVVVLEWTNPNCPFVQRVYKEIMPSVQKKYSGKVVWLTVNSTNPDHSDFESAEDLKKTYDDWHASFVSMLLDPDGKIGKMFDAKTTPHMFIIDQDGKLVYAGGIDDDPRGGKQDKVNYVDVALTNLLAGKEIPTSTTRSYGCSVKY
jgi:peroxiredoxin